MGHETEPLDALQAWYEAQCNGDWEHSYGVKIDTLDNPGWMVTIDLRETRWQDLALERRRQGRSTSNWIQYEITDQQYIASGGSRNLVDLIRMFLDVVEHGKRS